MFGEVLYFTRLAVNAPDGGLQFTNVALVCSFSPPNNDILWTSCMTLPLSCNTDVILVIEVYQIIGIVGMIPHGDFFLQSNNLAYHI